MAEIKTIENGEQDEEIAVLKTDMKWIKQELGDIKDNHLRGIYRQLGNLNKQFQDHKVLIEKRPTWLIVGVFSTMCSLIIALVSYIVFGK